MFTTRPEFSGTFGEDSATHWPSCSEASRQQRSKSSSWPRVGMATSGRADLAQRNSSPIKL